MLKSFNDFTKTSSSLEVELTSICNSRCVGCSRFQDFYFDNPHYQPGKYLDIDVFLEKLPQWENLDFLLFCGNYGDPLLHPRFEELVTRIRALNRDLRILVHTNGSFGGQKFWSSLGPLFKQRGSYIKFSIDGLQKSHEVFRRGTDWNKVIDNAETFIASGGNAIWQMIDFKHNHHEIDECREFSHRMGFKRFDLRKNNYSGLDDYILSAPNALGPSRPQDISWDNLQSWHNQHLTEASSQTIQCKSLGRKNLYLDVHGHLWPCCWVGGLPYRPEDHLRKHFIHQFLNNNWESLNEISIQNRSLEQILSSNIFKSIEDSIQNISFSTCKRTCGNCSSPISSLG